MRIKHLPIGKEMSFLEQLQLKKQTLKPTETVVTQPDGRRFLHNKEISTEFPNNGYGFIIDTKPDDIPAKITEHVYLGSQDCCEVHILQRYNITNILSVGIEAPVKYKEINYKFIQCLDLPETVIGDILEESIHFIEDAVKQRVNVLVHCNAGVSRSPTIVIGFLMFVHKYSFPEALGVVKAARSCVQPNSGFLDQLRRLQH